MSLGDESYLFYFENEQDAYFQFFFCSASLGGRRGGGAGALDAEVPRGFV